MFIFISFDHPLDHGYVSDTVIAHAYCACESRVTVVEFVLPEEEYKTRGFMLCQGHASANP
jgi:hypothetical protein